MHGFIRSSSLSSNLKTLRLSFKEKHLETKFFYAFSTNIKNLGVLCISWERKLSFEGIYQVYNKKTNAHFIVISRSREIFPFFSISIYKFTPMNKRNEAREYNVFPKELVGSEE